MGASAPHVPPLPYVSTPASQPIYCIESAHGQLVRDLDFNPNKQYYLASCGDDCKVKSGQRNAAPSPSRLLEEHSHWCVPGGGAVIGVIYFADYCLKGRN